MYTPCYETVNILEELPSKLIKMNESEKGHYSSCVRLLWTETYHTIGAEGAAVQATYWTPHSCMTDLHFVALTLGDFVALEKVCNMQG